MQWLNGQTKSFNIIKPSVLMKNVEVSYIYLKIGMLKIGIIANQNIAKEHVKDVKKIGACIANLNFTKGSHVSKMFKR